MLSGLAALQLDQSWPGGLTSACLQCISVEMKLKYLRARKQATGVTDARDFIRLEQELMSLANIKARTPAQHTPGSRSICSLQACML